MDALANALFVFWGNRIFKKYSWNTEEIDAKERFVIVPGFVYGCKCTSWTLWGDILYVPMT